MLFLLRPDEIVFQTATQENFELRRQLDLAEETSAALIAELQAEISQLKEKIIERNQRGSSEHSLREEIERLNFQLAVSGQTNDSLTRELKTVNESLRREKISMEELAQDSKSRESERNILAEKKEDLEKQILILKLEKDSLSNSLENAVSKIGSMERKQQDQENVMRLSEREVEELKTSNNYLLEKLELWSMSHSSSPTLKTSLMSELELSTSDSDTSLQRSRQFDIIDEEKEDDLDIEVFETNEHNEDASNRDMQNIVNFEDQVKSIPHPSCPMCTFFQMKGIEFKIMNLNEKLKSKSGLFSTSGLSESLSSPIKMTKLQAVVEELEILINDNFLNRKFDLLNKGSQTDEAITEDEDEGRIELTEELRKSKIKLTEMENENTKVNFVIKGLCEKVIYFLAKGIRIYSIFRSRF